jgi:hypothetical protein
MYRGFRGGSGDRRRALLAGLGRDGEGAGGTLAFDRGGTNGNNNMADRSLKLVASWLSAAFWLALAVASARCFSASISRIPSAFERKTSSVLAIEPISSPRPWSVTTASSRPSDSCRMAASIRAIGRVIDSADAIARPSPTIIPAASKTLAHLCISSTSAWTCPRVCSAEVSASETISLRSARIRSSSWLMM